LPDDRFRRIAYAGKLALVCGVALGVIAGLVSRGDPTPRESTFALVVADGGPARIGLLFGFAVAGLSFGAALADGGMGAALGGVTGHTSLAHFGLPAGPGAGSAPVWLFVVVVLAPAAVAATVWRRLARERPTE